MKADRRRPRSIPRAALPREGKTPGAATRYVLRGKLVAAVCWHDSGQPAWVWHYDADGMKHGLERYYFEDGRVQWETRHVHGLQHGPQRQWDARGRLICETHFVRGTGRDLWWGNDGGSFLSELRELVDGQRHGVEQWWSSPRRVHEESWFFAGLPHGVQRQWGDGHRLRRGFPVFYIHGRRVTRSQYDRAAISDPTLRPYVAAEDRPTRRCPVPPGGVVRR